MRAIRLIFLAGICATAAFAQAGDYRLALPDHKGQLKWSADGFKVVQNSAKPHENEIGIRGQCSSGLTFLGFLFLVPESAPATGTKCRDEALSQDKRTDATLKIAESIEIPREGGLPVALADYTTTNRDGSTEYLVRGFVATGDICGDLAFYSSSKIHYDDPALKRAFLSFQFDPTYTPVLGDVVIYADVLFRAHQYQAAAPMFEKGLSMVPWDGAPFQSAIIARRIMRDQAGMSYGIAGDLVKARATFEEGVRKDPDYPLNYYNLACADAGEKKLSEARLHLQQAFDRKANTNPGEKMPVPTEDDSFLPYKDNAEFWNFLKGLQASR